MRRVPPIVLIALILLSPVTADAATRIKDLVTVKGVRSNMLEGIGLVVGLSGTGDSPRSVASQAVQSYLRKRGLNVSAADLRLRNVAFVTVAAELPPYAATGARVDVKVMASGDARSLRGGALLITPLLGINGAVYAVAQGSVTVGGFSASSAGGLASIRRNTPTSGRIPAGALVEKEVPTTFVKDNQVVLALKDADFTTAFRIAKAINEGLKGQIAATENPGAVLLKLPERYLKNPIEFISLVEAIQVEADVRARVVLNERTGTVVVGGRVTVNPAAVAHGNLSVSVNTDLNAAQPRPLAQGRTVVVPNGDVKVQQGKGALRAIPATTTVDELVKALNALGASPQDLISILQALKVAGALNGDIEVQ